MTWNTELKQTYRDAESTRIAHGRIDGGIGNIHSVRTIANMGVSQRQTQQIRASDGWYILTHHSAVPELIETRTQHADPCVNLDSSHLPAVTGYASHISQIIPCQHREHKGRPCNAC